MTCALMIAGSTVPIHGDLVDLLGLVPRITRAVEIRRVADGELLAWRNAQGAPTYSRTKTTEAPPAGAP